jgi:4-hydroxy-tetrahydrodipicolinate synthase
MSKSPFRGIWPALCTPLGVDGSIDADCFVAHALDLIAAGCAGVTPFGTTGEGPSFSVAERIAAVEALVAGGVAPQQIVVSTSCAAITDAITLTRHAVAKGAQGVLLMPPFYFKGVSDAGIVAAYRQIIDTVADERLRVYLYHIPQVSGVALSHAVIAQLVAEYPQQIAGIKDSAGDRAWSLGLARAFMPKTMVYVGHEPDLVELGRIGSTGAISGLANFMPRHVQALVCDSEAPDTPAKLALIEHLLAELAGQPLLPALKAILALVDGHDGWRRVRAPLVAVDDAAFRHLGELVLRLGIGTVAD